MNADLKAYYQNSIQDTLITCVALFQGGNKFYFCDQNDDFSANIDGVPKVFEARALTATRPSRNGGGTFDASIVLDDVDLHISSIVDAAVAAGQTLNVIVYRYLASHQGFNYAQKQVFDVESVQRSSEAMQFTCGRPNIKNIKWPKKIYTAAEFPDLEKI